MPIEVLLMAEVKDLGAEGDVVKVAEGYARNCLFPQKLAAPVTEGTRRRLAKMQKERDVRRKEEVQKARAVASSIEKNSFTIVVKVGAEDKMFGSVTGADLSETLKSHGIEIDKRQLELEKPLKELGVYEVKVKVHPEVEAIMKVWIVQE